MNFLLILVAYLCGSIPFGLLLGRLKGVDVRQAGSGNIGATNVSRLAGRSLGLATLLADCGKAILPMLAARWWLGGPPAAPRLDLWVALAGAAAFLGHLFPVYLKFKGGKGVATALGVFLLLEPWAALISIGVFGTTIWLWGYVSLGSIIAAALMPFWVLLLHGHALHIGLAVFIGLLVVLKHSANIGRLWRGEENRWKRG